MKKDKTKTKLKISLILFIVSILLIQFAFLGRISGVFTSNVTDQALEDNFPKTSENNAFDNCTFTAAVSLDTFRTWGPTSYQSSVGDWMKDAALETLFAPQRDSGDYIPVLATGYTVEEYWPSEQNSFGWNNTDGMRVVNITLRENVKFHDGSEWNATVAKWNIDRAYVLVSNLTGSEGFGHINTMSHMTSKPGIDYEPFFTETWNHSYAYSNDPVNGLPVAPQYYGKNNDPNLSWTNVSQTYIADGDFSIINKTLIVKDASQTASGTGGTIQIQFNDHVTDLRLIGWIPMISMEQYKDMFYTQIYDNFDWTGDQLACGTGPYEAVEVDKGNEIMKLERFDDYWNFTELRATGKMIVKEGLISYFSGDFDGQLTTTAMTSGDADFALNGPYGPLFDDQLKASPLLDYFDTGPADNIEQLDFILPNTDPTFRKAVSFAFNYTQYLLSVKEGKAIRCDNLFGENSIYVNQSIVGSYHNLTIARTALLNDPKYSSVLINAGIDGTSTTAEWDTFAANVGSLNTTSQELFTFNYLHDIFNVDFTSILETNLADIGIVINKSGATPSNTYGDWKTLSVWGIWYPLLVERQAWYDKDLEGFHVDWPGSKIDFVNLDVFYTYKKIYVNGTWISIPDIWNWGLINDPVLQEKVRALDLQDEADKLKSCSTIQKRVGTEIYTTMFISQDTQGYAVSKNFSIDWYWGGFSFAYVSVNEFMYWDQVPTDQISEIGSTFSYDVNGSASLGIVQYWVDNTINFQIDENGIITNATFLSLGEYWLEIGINNTLASNLTTTIKITVQHSVFNVELSHPGDIIYIEGETGNEILWQITCSNTSNPYYYIYKNNSLIRDDSWQLGDSFLVNVDNLSEGIYEYKIEVVNREKEFSDIVRVIVNAKPLIAAIPGYNLIFFLGVLGIIGSISALYLKRKNLNS